MHLKIREMRKENLVGISTKDIAIVIIQFLLIICHFFDIKYPIYSFESSSLIINLLAILIIFLGSIGLIISLKELGLNTSPFPKPRRKSNLITSGIYSKLRHPMYYSLLTISFGIFLKRLFIYNLILTFLLWILILIKIKTEEYYLIKKYPNYNIYKKSVKY